MGILNHRKSLWGNIIQQDNLYRCLLQSIYHLHMAQIAKEQHHNFGLEDNQKEQLCLRDIVYQKYKSHIKYMKLHLNLDSL